LASPRDPQPSTVLLAAGAQPRGAGKQDRAKARITQNLQTAKKGSSAKSLLEQQAAGIYEVKRVCGFESQLLALSGTIVLLIPRFLAFQPPPSLCSPDPLASFLFSL